MYRVYDKETNKFIDDNIYMSPDDELYVLKRNIFGISKLIPVSYECQRDIGLYDKNGMLIFEGDILEATVSDDKIVKGVVAYAQEFSAYIILCFQSYEYYALGNEVSKNIQVIGNVFQNKELIDNWEAIYE